MGVYFGQALRPVLVPMGAYLSSPITEKETFVGGKAGFLEFGGSSMQVSEVLCRLLNTLVMKLGKLGITALALQKK